MSPLFHVFFFFETLSYFSPQSNKVPVVQPSHAVHPLTPLITYSDEHFAPGSHSGHHPQDANNKQGKPSPATRPDASTVVLRAFTPHSTISNI